MRLWHQLLIALVVPAVLVTAAIAYFGDLAARRALDAALGERLCTVAQAAATLVDPRVTLLERGDALIVATVSAIYGLGDPAVIYLPIAYL